MAKQLEPIPAVPTTEKLLEVEAKAGVVMSDSTKISKIIEEEARSSPEGQNIIDKKKVLAAFGRSGSSKQMIRQGNSSARRFAEIDIDGFFLS